MFKNMSFGKMVGLFAGFLVVTIVLAVVAIKFSQKGAAARQVTTKSYKQRDQETAALGQAASAPPAQPTNSAPDQAPAFNPQPATAPTWQANGALPPVAGGGQMMGLPPAAAVQPTGALPPPPVDLAQRLNSIDNSLASMDTRLTSLEEARASTVRTQAPRKASSSANSRRSLATAEKKDEQHLTKMQGYKSMAVVNGRAWLVTPDGRENSVTRDDLLPQAHIRSMNADTGVVITTTDERIDPR